MPFGPPHTGKFNIVHCTMISFGNFSSLFLFGCFSTFVRNRSNGSIYGFGLNNYFQLGIKKESSEQVFHPMLTPFTDVKSITGQLISSHCGCLCHMEFNPLLLDF